MGGGLVRCVACGEVEWSLLGKLARDARCRVCGEPLAVERRRPGRRFGHGRVERRDARPATRHEEPAAALVKDVAADAFGPAAPGPSSTVPA